ncbi:MAG: ABC transporter substrate-binding protein, partial [Gloeobacteraceae cyanobacterium ES-bin-316]|nr:ABC transporter substrate-binding protein [Ferruginibacter sp.]
MKIRLILIFTLLFTQLFVNTSAQTTKIRLQLKWWDQFQFAGFYAAEIKGFYEAENLDVDILPGKQNISPVSEVMNGNADFAVTGADLLVHFTEGQPLKVLGAIFQHSPYVVISPKENNIYNPINFIGKKVMCSQNQGLVELKAMALRNRVPLNSIIFKEHTWNNNDLINGNADAMTGYTSVEVFQLEEKGVTLNLVKPSNYGIDFYGDVIFCSKETVEKRRGITDRFLKASFRGWDYAMKHPEEMADYILSLPGVKERGVTKKALMFEAEEMSKLILPSLVEIGHMSETRWQDILDIYKGLNLIGKTKTLEGFIYNQQKASEENFLETGLIIMSVILVIVALLFAYSISLKRAVTKRTKELEAEIIQRKKQEAGLEKISNELKLSNSELQQFAYLTSHNLRAPVTNLRSLLKLFDKGSLVEKNKILFEKIEFSVNNFNQMLSDLNEILSVRREESAPPEEISFAQELDHVMSSINETISEQQLKVKA